MFTQLCQIGVAFLAIGVFLYIAWIDSRTMEIPDGCHWIIIGIGCLEILCGQELMIAWRGIGFIIVSLPMFLANFIRQDSFGGGDIKMCGATGFLLGASQVIAGTLLAFMAAGLYCGVQLVAGKMKAKDSFPLGPFLSFGYIIIILAKLLDFEIWP